MYSCSKQHTIISQPEILHEIKLAEEMEQREHGLSIQPTLKV